MRNNMVVTRLAKGPADLTEPKIETMECWVELYGIPTGSLEEKGIVLRARNVGVPISASKYFFHAGQKAYKLRMIVKLTESLQDKIKLGHKQLGRVWVTVVYENVKGVCMFCGFIGHDKVHCPIRQRALRMKYDERHQETMGAINIPDTRVGKWITNRGFIPRGLWLVKQPVVPGHGGAKPTEGVHDIGESSNKGKGEHIGGADGKARGMRLKRGVNNTITQGVIVIMENVEEASQQEIQAEENRHLNFKRARETIPNSSPRDL